MQRLLPFLVLALPLVPLVAALAGVGRPARIARRALAGAAWLSLGLSILGVVAGLVGGPVGWRWAPLPDFPELALSVRWDPLSSVFAVLVCWLAWAVVRFSRTYLEGDPREGAYYVWLGLTFSSVLAWAVAGNLLVLLIGWVFTGACLHRLLNHRRDRPGARAAASQKRLVGRLAELLMLGALGLSYHAFGTWEFDRLFGAIAAGAPAETTVLALLLVGAAALSSAQVPFHTWLPDTMETPTPVSAFMHAGIINAGGFLVLRLSPLISAAPAAQLSLGLIGGATAAFGAVVMLTQPTVKRALAYSTIAQMGFMLLQCGLGAYGLALLHLLAHAVYKAHAFLHAGSTVEAPARAAVPLRAAVVGGSVLMSALLVTALSTAWAAAGLPTGGTTGILLLPLAFALAYGLARLWSVVSTRRARLGSLFAAALVCSASLLLHHTAGAFVWGQPPAAPHPALLGVVAFLFAGLFACQCLVWCAGRSAVGRSLYLHALNGFYLGTAVNRLLRPRRAPGLGR